MKSHFVQYRTIIFLKYSIFMSLYSCPSEWLQLHCIYSTYLNSEIFHQLSLKSWHELQLKNNCVHGKWALKSFFKSVLLSAEPFHFWLILFPVFWFRTLLPRAMESVCGLLLTCTPLDKNKCQSNYIKTSVSSASSGYHGQYRDSKVTFFECAQSVSKVSSNNISRDYCVPSNLVRQVVLDEVHIRVRAQKFTPSSY